MQESFALLSDKLLEIQHLAREQKAPVLELWLERGLNGQDLGKGNFDEEQLLDNVAEMVGDTDCFCFEPEIIDRLREYLKTVQERKELYLIFALNVQKRRLTGLISGLGNGDLEKRLVDLGKYIARARTELENLMSLEERRRLDESYQLRMLTWLKKRSKRLSIRLPIDTFILDVTGQAVGESEKIAHELWSRHQDRVEKCKRSIADMNLEMSVLGPRIELRKKLTELLEKTKLRLDELEKSSEVVSPANPVEASAEDQVVIKKSPENTRSKNGKKGRDSDRARDSERGRDSDRAKDSERGKDSDRPFSKNIEPGKMTDSDRLKGIVDLANRSRLPIRVMVPTGHETRFCNRWEALLSLMGFEGEVICVDYHVLDRTSDFESPVIVPKKMNTHHMKWDRSAFSNLVVVEVSSPRLLMTIIQENRKVQQAEERK